MELPTRPAPPALERFDRRFVRFMRLHGLELLRWALGVVFVWFGALKVFGQSPVEDLVARTVYWAPPDLFVPLLGAWEVLVGLGLLAGRFMRVVLFLFWLQLAGTFLVLVVQPGLAFHDGNPFLLTMEGEFVLKNVVLIAAGIVLGGTVHQPLRLPTLQSRAP